MDYRELGQRVFARRREMGLSQGALAQSAGISRNYVSLIERGEAHNVSVKIIDQLAVALGMTSTQLMGQSDQDAVSISPALREFGLQENLSFEIIDRLARLPRRGREPQSVEEWKALYRAIRPYIEEIDSLQD